MQKISLIILIACGMLSAGCNKFLDERPQSELTPKEFWKTEDDIKAAMAGVYDGVQGAFDDNWVYWGDGRTDNMDVTQYGNKQYSQNGLSATTAGRSEERRVGKECR